jgi:hypothetical protein
MQSDLKELNQKMKELAKEALENEMVLPQIEALYHQASQRNITTHN